MESGATGSTTRPELLAIGQRLKAARELRHLTLESVQDATNIRQAYLKAIEEGRADDVPGEVFLKGFVRTYGNHLGLDGAAIVEGYKQALLRSQADEGSQEAGPHGRGRRPNAAEERLTRLRRARAQPRRGAGRWRGWWVAALAVVAVAAWAVDRGLAQPGTSSVALTPSASAPDASSSRSSPRPSSTVPPASDASVAAPAPPAVQVGFAQSVTGWQGSYLVTGATGVHVTIAANAACWTRRWVDGSTAFTDQYLAETGPETVTWDAAHTLKIQLGNAPGISWIRVDNQTTPPLPRQDSNPEWLTFSLASG